MEDAAIRKTKKERLDEVLKRLMNVGQLKASAIVSTEGLLITSRTPPEMNERIIAALCSTVMASAETASSQMSIGKVSEISVRTDEGTIFLSPAGQKALLVGLAEPEAQAGLILMEMESKASQTQEILEED
ncbi:MAG: roadblock/LC7 domain-containing protein [Methanomassiliicoccales archaeon]|nr:MAG: roadblock/LC7 domain-containing protein [Methanomassiliicoccales archaeon]